MDKERLLYAGEFLENNLFEPLTVEDIAASAAMSLRSLQRHFADSVGESLASYVRGRRLTQAAQFIENFVAAFTHNVRTRIHVFVNAVSKSHQTEWVILILGLFNVFGNTVKAADFSEHFEHFLVCAAVRRAPQTGDTRGDTGDRIGA